MSASEALPLLLLISTYLGYFQLLDISVEDVIMVLIITRNAELICIFGELSFSVILLSNSLINVSS